MPTLRAGELNLDRTIWGMRRANDPGRRFGREAARAAEDVRCRHHGRGTEVRGAGARQDPRAAKEPRAATGFRHRDPWNLLPLLIPMDPLARRRWPSSVWPSSVWPARLARCRDLPARQAPDGWSGSPHRPVSSNARVRCSRTRVFRSASELAPAAKVVAVARPRSGSRAVARGHGLVPAGVAARPRRGAARDLSARTIAVWIDA